MIRKLVLLLSVIWALPCFGQASLDYFGGRTDVSCPAPVNQISGTVVQSGTTSVTFTPSNVTAVVVDSQVAADWDVTMSNGNVVIYGPNEAMEVTNSATVLDYTTPNGASQTQGALSLTSIATSAPFAFTLTSPVSQTVGLTAANLYSAHGYMSASINKPVYGAGPGYCNQLGHYMYPQVVSQLCVQLDGGLCAYQYTISGTLSRTGGVTTITTSTTPANIALGSKITVNGAADSSFNCPTAAPCQVQSISGSTLTYNNPGPDGSSGGIGGGGCTGSTACIHTSGWSLKYPANGSITSPCVAATAIVSKNNTLGFQGVGEDSTAEVTNLQGTCALNPAVPFELNPGGGTTAFIITYSASNFGGDVSQPLHDLIHTMDRGFSTPTFGVPGAIPDVFDSRLVAFDLSHFGGTNFVTEYQSPAACCALYDDSDNFKATCGSGLFPGVNGGATNGEGSGQCWHPGLIVAFSPLHETAAIWTKGFTSTQIDTHVLGPYLYPDSTNYSKRFTGVKPGCWSAVTLTAPSGNLFNIAQAFCTWTDWACTWYGTIGAINASWGSNYTTCGSSETTTTGEVYATGDGVSTVFAHTFANVNVTPNSIAVLMNGVQVSGDCRGAPNAEKGCTAGTGQGNFIVVHAFQNSQTLPVGFILIDSNSNYEEVTVKGTTGSSAPSWPGTCTGTQTTASGSATLTCLGPSISSGSLTYASGVATITFAHALPTQDTITVSYTSCGWDTSCDTGLADEDGSNTTWTGTNPVCVVAPTPWTAGMTYVAWKTEIFDSVSNTWQLAEGNGTAGGSRPSFSSAIGGVTNDNGVTLASVGFPVCAVGSTIIPHAIDANQNWANDVTNWAGYGYTAQGLSGLHGVVNRLFLGALDLGPNFSIQGYDIPMYYQSLQAQAAFTDGAFTGLFPMLDADDPGGTIKAKYIMNYYPKPIFTEYFNQVRTGWEVNDTGCAVAANCQANPTARITHFYNNIKNSLSLKSPAGLTQAGGLTWWGNAGFQGHGFGFMDKNENRQNGVENVTATVACSAPLATSTCGGNLAAAPWTGTDTDDGPTGLIAALALWRAIATTPVPSPAPVMFTKVVVSERKESHEENLYHPLGHISISGGWLFTDHTFRDTQLDSLSDDNGDWLQRLPLRGSVQPDSFLHQVDGHTDYRTDVHRFRCYRRVNLLLLCNGGIAIARWREPELGNVAGDDTDIHSVSATYATTEFGRLGTVGSIH